MLGEYCLKQSSQYSVRFWKSYFLKPLWRKISNCRHVTFPFLLYYPVSFSGVRSALVWVYWLTSNPSATSLISIGTFPCFTQPCQEVLESLNKHAHPQTSDLLLSTTCESICSCICQLGWVLKVWFSWDLFLFSAFYFACSALAAFTRTDFYKPCGSNYQ